MCGRYYCDQDCADFAQTIYSDESIEEGDIYPSEEIHVIVYRGNKVTMEKMSWGYTISKGLVINARSETLLEKELFQNDALHHHCLIVSKGFYEWDTHKHKISFQSQQGGVLLMAGIYRGHKKEVAIITTKANDLMRPIHSRMPLFIKQEDMYEWLTCYEKTQDFLKHSFDDLEIVSGNMQQSLF